jgi:hypothetical protein
MVTPGQTMTPPPSQTLFPRVTASLFSQPARRRSASRGCTGVRSCTLGPIWQSAPMVTAPVSRKTALKLTNVRAPMLMR